MSTITKPPFPVIFSKKTSRKAQKPPTTMLGPFQQMSSKGFVKKLPETMKLSGPSVHAIPVHQSDPLRSEQSIPSSWLALVSSVATMPGKKLEDVDEAVSSDSAVEEAVEEFLGYSSESGFRFRYKRKKFVKKLKINKKLEKYVVLDDGYSNCPFRHHKKKETMEFELEGQVLLSGVVPRKPRKTPPPAFVPNPPARSWRNVPPRGLHAYKIVMRWPGTFLRMGGRFTMQHFPRWFCVYFLRPLFQSNNKHETVSKENMKEFLEKLGLYSTMCELRPAFGEEECEFWANMYRIHGSKSDMCPADYFAAGLIAAASLFSAGYLPRLTPGIYTKREFENAYDYKVDITVEEYGESFLVKEFTIPLDCHLHVCPGKGCFTEAIAPEAMIVIPGFVGVLEG